MQRIQSGIAIWITALACSQALAEGPAPAGALEPKAEHSEKLILVSRYMGLGLTARSIAHFRAAEVIDAYALALDARQSLLTEAELGALRSGAQGLDPVRRQADLQPILAVYARMQFRAREKLVFMQSLLAEPARLSTLAGGVHSGAERGWPASTLDMQERWRRELADDARELAPLQADPGLVAARLSTRYARRFERMRAATVDSIVTEFLKIYVHALDAQAAYYIDDPELDRAMLAQKSRESGIGVSVEIKNQAPTIVGLVLRGAADQSGRLGVGDRIVGVAQGRGEAMIDTVALPIQELRHLLGGTAGSTVLVEVVPRDVTKRLARRVELIRSAPNDQHLRATASTMTVAEGKQMRKIGIISLPSFYNDFNARRRGDRDYLSATRDVERILSQFKQQGVHALLLDLRNNGGGALVEAISVAGLFLKGPVLQQRTADGRIEVSGMEGSTVAWSGPLAVLINSRSAAASEIVAAAIQDYGRGLILGQQSYGSGTVQTMVDLGRLRKEAAAWGDLKLTIAQFFRASGSSTQIRGVIPDIVLARPEGQEAPDETRHDRFVPWAEIAPAAYTRLADLRPVLAAIGKRREESKLAGALKAKTLLEEASAILALHPDVQD